MRAQIPQSRVGKERNDVFSLEFGTLGELGGGVESRA